MRITSASILCLQIGYDSTCGAQGGGNALDIGNYCAGHPHFRHLAVIQKAVLQIVDDLRCLARTQVVEHRDAAKAVENAFADRVENTALIHRVRSWRTTS